MPPKLKSKSRLGSAVNKGWEEGLQSAQFCEENVWMASLAMLVGSQPDDDRHTDALGIAINVGSRKLFSYISRDDLYSQAMELGAGSGGKNAKGGKNKSDGPAFQEICEACKPYLDAGEELPLSLLARLIKFRLLAIKDADLKRREAEKKTQSDKDGGAKGKGDASKSAAKLAKGGGDKKGLDTTSPKTESKLKKRGDAELDGKFINDEPDDGPQHYIILSGFHQPHLLSFLAEVGVGVDCIVRIETKPPSNESSQDATFNPATSAATNVAAAELDEESAKKQQQAVSQLEKFWRDVLPIMDRAPESSSLHDVARLSYVVDPVALVQEHAADEIVVDARSALGMSMFDDISSLLYNLSDAKRHWKNYLANLKLIKVPAIGSVDPKPAVVVGGDGIPMPPSSARLLESAAQPVVPDPEQKMASVPDVDMRYYNELMNNIPLESTSIPLMVQCMLEQVCAMEENRPPPSEAMHPPRTDGLNDNLAKHMSTIAFKLALSDEQKRELYYEFIPPQQPNVTTRKPMLISYHDDITRRLNHLRPVDGFDPTKAELECLGYTRLGSSIFSGANRTSGKIAAERAARFQKFLCFCNHQTEANPSEITHALRQFIFECMDLSAVDEYGLLSDEGTPHEQRQLNIPWDDPYPYYVGMIPAATDEERMEAEMLNKEQEQDGLLTPGSTINPDILATDETGIKIASRDGPSTENVRLATSGSILKRQPSSGIKRTVSSAHSVHFDDGPDKQQQQSAEEDDADVDHEMLVSEWQQPTPSHSSLTISEAAEDPMTVVNRTQKRILDAWCFAEHMEPKILLQAMLKALETHASVDIYYHRRDQSFLVVLHNPFHDETRHNTSEWRIQVHSNVRFRDYLEHVAGTIVEWIQQEEAKYQAVLLAAEVQRLHNEELAKSSEEAAAEDTKRARSKSPKKPPGAKGKTPPGSPERVPSALSNPLIRNGSIKAWKEEQERLKLEMEEEEKLAAQASEDKRSRSRTKMPKGKELSKEDLADAEKLGGDKLDKLAPAKDKRRPDSSKHSVSKIGLEKVESEMEHVQPPEPEKYWPFVGYDMGGGGLLQATGIVSKMFPSDGGQIATERIQFVQGATSIKSTVKKDGHTFTVHVLDPVIDEATLPRDCGTLAAELGVSASQESTKENQQQLNETANGTGNPEVVINSNATVGSNASALQTEGELAGDPITSKSGSVKTIEKMVVGHFGSFTAQFSDGITVALSTYGPNGEPPSMKKFEPEPYVPPPPRAPSPPPDKKGDKGGKKGGKEKDKKEDKNNAAEAPAVVVEEEKVEAIETKADSPHPAEPFQQLYVSCPDGLAVTYFLESSRGITSNEGRLLVRQSYPLKTRGSQNCEAARRHAMEEVSRVIRSDGTVVRTLIDGSVQILCPDGTVILQCMSSPLLPAITSMLPEPTESTAKYTAAAPPNKRSKSVVNQKSEIAELNMAASSHCEELQGAEKPFIIVTLPSGERIANRACDDTEIVVPKAIVCIMSDPQTSQVMHTRDDNVVTVYYPDNTTVVEHADGTRITTVVKEVSSFTELPETAETGEVMSSEKLVSKLVMVECPGFASVKFDSSSGLCSTEFGVLGTTIECMPRDGGSYTIFPTVDIEPMPGNGGGGGGSGANCCLRIDVDGTAVYYPCRNTLSPTDHAAHYYVMRHFDDVIIETIDTIGCHYIVTRTGDNHVGINEDKMVMVSGRPEEMIGEVSAECQGILGIGLDASGEHLSRRMSNKIVTYDEHAPRLFVVSNDGSVGAELLRQRDIATYLLTAERNPEAVVLTEHLPDCSDVLCITVLRRTARNVSDRWLRPYVQDTVVPPGLRSSIKAPPRKNVSKDSKDCGFATRVGRGLDIGTWQSSKMTPAVGASTAACPPTLEIRQILQFRPVTDELRTTLEEGLKAYANQVKEQELAAQEAELVDPRSAVEVEAASKALHDAEICNLPPPVDVDVDQLYIKAMMCGYIHTPPSTPEKPRKKADVEKAVREVELEKECLRALREHHVPPYFESDVAECLLQTKQTYNKQELANQVWGNTASDGGEFSHIPCAPVDRTGTVNRWSRESKEMPAEMTDADDTADISRPMPEAIEPFEKLYKFENDGEGQVEELEPDQGQPIDYAAVVGDGFPAEGEVKFSPPTGASNSHFQLPDLSATVDELFDVPGVQQVEEVNTNTNNDTARSNKSNNANDSDVDFKMLPLTGTLAELFAVKPGEIPAFVERLAQLNPSAPPLTPIPPSVSSQPQSGRSKQSRNSSNISPTGSTRQSNRDGNTDLSNPGNSNPSNASNSDQSNAGNSDQGNDCNTNQNNMDDPSIIINSKSKLFLEDQRSGTPTVFINDRAQQFINDAKESTFEDSLERPRRCNASSGREFASVIQSRAFDVAGQPRPALVPVPAYLYKMARPGATPNYKFAEVEEPVRRKLNNVPLTGATPKGLQTIKKMRGLSIIPDQLDFGILKEGCTYSFCVGLMNTGVDACRFRVRQPPLGTGIKVVYSPGPVAAGMKTELNIEIYAIAAGVEGSKGIGCVSHDLQITTETDNLMLPIAATVLTASEFDNRSENSPTGGKAPGVKLVSSKPPVSTGALRPPRKCQDLRGKFVAAN